jgi:hypothetical protein
VSCGFSSRGEIDDFLHHVSLPGVKDLLLGEGRWEPGTMDVAPMVVYLNDKLSRARQEEGQRRFA